LQSRFTKEDLGELLTMAGIINFQVNPTTEDVNLPGQHLKPIFLNEVLFTKA